MTEAQLPYQLASSEERSNQLTLDFEVLENGAITHDQDPVLEGDDSPVALIEADADGSPQNGDPEDEAIEADEIIVGQDRDDPMMRVAARFAAARNPAE